MEIKRDKDLEAIDIKSIKTFYMILLISIILALVSFFVVAFILMSRGQLLNGVLYIVIGTPSCIIAWSLTKPLIGLFYDVKIMRYHLDNQAEKDIVKQEVKTEEDED